MHDEFDYFLLFFFNFVFLYIVYEIISFCFQEIQIKSVDRKIYSILREIIWKNKKQENIHIKMN